MSNVSDSLIMEKVEKNRERGIKLGLFGRAETPDIESLIDVDILWNILNISHKIEVGDSTEEAIHRMMLQYANLNKVRAINRQTRSKANDAKVAESQFDRIVREMIVKDKSIAEGATESLKKKKADIVKKVISQKELSDDEQIILDAAAEAEI